MQRVREASQVLFAHPGAAWTTGPPTQSDRADRYGDRTATGADASADTINRVAANAAKNFARSLRDLFTT